MVNLQDTPSAGPIRAIDLERDTNTGRIYHLRRVHLEPGAVISDDEAECGWLDSCAAEGGKHAEPAPAPMPRQSWLCAAWLRLVRWLN